MKSGIKPKNIAFKSYHKNKDFSDQKIDLPKDIESEIEKAHSQIFGLELKFMKYIFISLILIQIILIFIYL